MIIEYDPEDWRSISACTAHQVPLQDNVCPYCRDLQKSPLFTEEDGSLYQPLIDNEEDYYE